MLWTSNKKYQPLPFSKEKDLEKAIRIVEADLFGTDRIYLDPKKKIGAAGKTNNIPDGYLIDLSSTRKPILYVVENELSQHNYLKHIAVQILEFSLSFESSPHTVKAIVKDALSKDKDKWDKCESFAQKNGFDNVDFLLESMIFGKDKFRALVIIDECVEELETVLVSRFKFPVEILTLEQYADGKDTAYRFNPFLADVSADLSDAGQGRLDLSEIDTIVVPAREEGFQEVFLGENKWYSIRIHSSMISQIKYLAVYQVAPISAITHIAPVERIEPWKDSGKYAVIFSDSATKLETPISLVSKGRVKAPQSLRYTSKARLDGAVTLDQVF
ncbi:hypothetical protein [Maridesulfovibrio frigidus]|uniref:hypothetical protein n=1 Tax=Maridesulfovibrio frigidus TaxID=340956 RepID=UPI0005527772|nr:hypothetical protein [Maridesulfovibrio frigidus]